jgi:anti-repressor protein
MTDIIDKIFKFEKHTIKVYGTSENPWFCAKDIALALGYTKTTNATNHIKDPNDKKPLSEIIMVPDSGTITYQEKTSIYINESGLYCMIFGSQLPDAIRFKNWVTKEVLPSIRKHG